MICVREGATMSVMREHIVAIAFLGFLVSGAWGQIVAVQDGWALDSNYRIGAGRVNGATPQRTTFSSQMYINGQVSGLSAFKGETGYYASNELRMTVPSAGLSGFRRQSVGLSDVLGGRTHRPDAYYDRATTALGLRGITSGQTAVGTNVPRSSYLGGLVPRKAMDEAMADFKPLLGNRMGQAISAQVQPAIRLDPSAPRVVGPRGLSAPTAPKTFGASELAVFTVSRPSQRSEVDVELRELEQLEEDDLSRIDSKRRGPNIVPELDPKGGALGGVGIANKASRESDVFLTMIYLLQKQHLDGSVKTGSPKAPSGAESDPEFKLKPLGPRPDSIALVEQGLRGELVFKTLAGKGSDAFNQAMRAGEKHLKKAAFYSAADQYRLAVEIQADNPTARLGLAASLFGAGESLGAALHLRRAMEIFPPVMVTKLDVMRKIPTEKLKVRLDQLYKKHPGAPGDARMLSVLSLGQAERYLLRAGLVVVSRAAGRLPVSTYVANAA